MAYLNTFSAGGPDLSAQTSDSGHTHTKLSGGGSLQISGGELIAVGGGNDAVYVASWTPAGADQELVAIFAGHDGSNNTIEAGLHVQPDGDGIWVQWETFSADPGVFNLYQTVGGVDTTLDSAPAPSFSDVTVEVRIVGSSIEWEINGVVAGTGLALPAHLAGAGQVGFKKFNPSTTSAGVSLESVAADDIGGGGPATVERSASLSSTGVISVAGQRVLQRSASLSSDGDIQVGHQRVLQRSASLTSDGDISVSGVVETGPDIIERSASLSSQGAITVGHQRVLQRAVSLSSQGVISVRGQVPGQGFVRDRYSAAGGFERVPVDTDPEGFERQSPADSAGFVRV